MRTAFVTGGTGFIGLNLVHALIARDVAVTSLYRPDSHTEALRLTGAHCVPGDVTDLESIRRAMPHRPDAVFHVAGNTNMWSRRNAEQTRDNVEGPRNVAAVALERGAGRFVHTSSIAAYGIHPGRIDETTPECASSSWINYPRTKALGEREIRLAIGRGLDAVILNPANVVGPHDLRNWSTMIWMAARGRLLGVPPGRGSFCHVHEVVQAHIAAFERGRTGENYLLGGTDASYLDAAHVVGRLVERRVPRRATPAAVFWLASRLMTWSYPLHRRRSPLTPEAARMTSVDLLCSDAKARGELGTRSVPLETMFEDCWRWMVAEGRIPGPASTPADDERERLVG